MRSFPALSAVLLFSVVQTAGGQSIPKSHAGYFAVGVAKVATEALDARLKSLGHPTFGSTAGMIGLGGYGIVKGRLMLSGEWNGLIMGQSEDANSRETGLGGGYVTLGLGYAVEPSARTRLYPRIGIGPGGMGVWTENDSTVTFDGVLTNPPSPERSTVLGREALVLDLGGGAEFLTSRTGRGMLIGLRFGYLATPVNSSWHYYDHRATGGPSSTIAGPYVRMMVGMVWR